MNDRDIDSYIYWGGPGGSFSAKNRARLRTHSSSGCIAADFNEDGYIDIAVANHKSFGDHVGDSFVLWNGPDGIDDRHPTRLPTAGPHGMLQVQPGNILDGSEREYYTSAPFELPAGAAVTRISVGRRSLVPKTWVGAQLRSAPTKRKPWTRLTGQAPTTEPDWFTNDQQIGPALPAGQWVQYRLALGAVNSGSTPAHHRGPRPLRISEGPAVENSDVRYSNGDTVSGSGGACRFHHGYYGVADYKAGQSACCARSSNRCEVCGGAESGQG